MNPMLNIKMNQCKGEDHKGCKTREQILTYMQGKWLWLILYSKQYEPEEYGSETFTRIGKVHPIKLQPESNTVTSISIQAR